MVEIFDIAGYTRISFEDDDERIRIIPLLKTKKRSLKILSGGSFPAPA